MKQKTGPKIGRPTDIKLTNPVILKRASEKDASLKIIPNHTSDLLGVLTSLVDNSSSSIFIKDIEGKYLLSNQNFADLLGVSRNEILNKKDSDFLPEKTVRELRRNAEKVLRESRPVNFEEQIEVNGEIRHFHSVRFPLRFSSDYPIAIGGILNETTENKRIQRALSESEVFHRIVLMSMSDAVFLTDDKGEFVFICPNVANIFGYSAEEVLGNGNISKLLPDMQIDSKELEKSGEIINIETAILDKYGKKHHLLINVKKVSIRGGTILYSCRDITLRKRAEEELKSTQTTLVTEQVALRRKTLP